MRSHFLIRIMVLLIGAVFATFLFSPNIAFANTPSDNPDPSGDEMCLVCHNRPDPVVIFSSGETLPVNIDPDRYRSSVHGEMSCATCHPTLGAYPHPEPTAQTLAEYRESYHDSCKDCHREQFNQVALSVHEEVFKTGVEGTPLCADCHQPHSQVQLCDPDEVATFEDRIWIAETCAACHEDLYKTYQESIHGIGLIEQHNPDMPTCIDCHDVHKICDPEEAAFRINSLEMCADCHTDPEVMDKYGHEVNVLNTYVVFHDTTVTMLEKYDTEELTSKPTCYDCHGIHNVDSMSNPPPAVFDMPGSELYPPIHTEEEPAPARNIAVTGALLGVLLGGAGTMTISQLIKESKKEKTKDQ